MTTRAKLFWVGVLYFAEGFPFGLLIDTFPVYFRIHGVSLAQIGLLNIVGLAWMLGWIRTLIIAAAVLALSALLCRRSPLAFPRGDLVEPRPSRMAQAVIAPLRHFLLRPGFAGVALFILTFKLGDMALGPMIKPFWVDRGFTPVEIGIVPGTVGAVSTIAGALLGGLLTERWGIFRALWVLGVFQAGSNLVYAGAAAIPPSAPLMYTASLVESFCGGLGTSPFLAFLMSLCSRSRS